MTLASLKTKANAKLVDFWGLLLPKQESYFLKHGKFFQLLVTDPVVDGADTTFQIRKPNDELHAVDVDFTFNSPIPFQISVDEWIGDESGFSVTVVVELPDGKKYTRNRTAVPIFVSGVITDWTSETSNWALVVEQTL